jgi:hypothetical protein
MWFLFHQHFYVVRKYCQKSRVSFSVVSSNFLERRNGKLRRPFSPHFVGPSSDVYVLDFLFVFSAFSSLWAKAFSTTVEPLMVMVMMMMVALRKHLNTWNKCNHVHCLWPSGRNEFDISFCHVILMGLIITKVWKIVGPLPCLCRHITRWWDINLLAVIAYVSTANET